MVYGSFNEAMKERGMESFILSSGLVKRMPLNTQKLVSKLEEAIKSNKKIFATLTVTRMVIFLACV